MSKLIDADAMIGGIKENNLGEWYVGRIDGKSEEVIPTDTVYKIIDSAPSIDIVRCKECKWCLVEEGGCERIGMVLFADEIENHFCGYGEREGE